MLEEIFYQIDEFCKFLEQNHAKYLLGNKKRDRKTRLNLSEILTICVYYHYSGFKNFKEYYHKGILRSDYPNKVSYNRFIELKQKAILPLALLSQLKSSQCSGISFIDSFSLKACHVKRQYGNKLFSTSAKKGKTSIGWFFGFKIHLVINDCGEIIHFAISAGNVSDASKKIINKITHNVTGKMIGDKGYIGLFDHLKKRGIKLIHRLRKNMKNKLMDWQDKMLLRKRGVVESVIGILKDQLQIEHTRHRSKQNFLSHIFSTLIAYAFRPKKPSIRAFSDNLITQP